MTVRIGYVGLDHHHRNPYLESIDQLDDAEVVAAVDPDGNIPADVGAESLSETQWYSSIDEACTSEQLDLVWLTLSNRDTPAAIEKAVDRGVDVFSEKPAARTAAELEPVADRIRSRDDVTVGFSYTWRGHPISQELRERAADGFFGDVRVFDLRFVASKLEARATGHYLFDREKSRGGIVQWLGVHWIDLLPWILDDPVVRVHASLSYDTDAVDVEDGAVVQFELRSGAVGTLTAGYFLRDGRYDTKLRVYGDEGRCSWDPMGTTFGFDGETTLELDADCWESTPHRTVTHEYDSTPGYGGSWGLSFFKQFLAARRGDAAVPADVDDALRVLRVLDAVYESASSGEWVEVQ
ncbi:Gfo/Idh/MocA family protein [Halorussus salinisoli]|uniref:Gfo/Idh/MocA family protein n=1 Tax=Halorussus salinisoli TaxID=2558242 RepID=UPI0010C16295|nr:Gfo/Idh/MocA family oxidoreductase [Halorussus salinisoli]